MGEWNIKVESILGKGGTKVEKMKMEVFSFFLK